MSAFAGWLASVGIDDGLDMLTISRSQFVREPQAGNAMRPAWQELAEMLSTARTGEKNGFGGYAFGAYADNHRKKTKIIGPSLGALVIDNDGGASVDDVADAFSSLRAIILETFSSTAEQPRCRLIVKLAEPVDVATYELAHEILRGKVRRCVVGAAVDDDAKDASRLSYWPVRPAGAPYAFRQTFGAELDAHRMIAAQPKQALPQRSPEPRQPIEHADRYKRAALRCAADALASASEGARHGTLNREAFALARLGLRDDEIADALLPSAIAAMGEGRRREAERTIRDAIRARRGAA